MTGRPFRGFGGYDRRKIFFIMLEMTFGDIASFVGILLGGGSLGGFLSWRYVKRKEKAEAALAETTAAKEMQDMYQEMIQDVKADREEQKAYIQELKDDRNHLREERNELRRRQDELDERVSNLQHDVARNVSMIEEMKPLLCRRTNCAIRIPTAPHEGASNDIEPLDMKDM